MPVFSHVIKFDSLSNLSKAKSDIKPIYEHDVKHSPNEILEILSRNFTKKFGSW